MRSKKTNGDAWQMMRLAGMKDDASAIYSDTSLQYQQ